MKKKRGFTLIECMVVSTIVALLAMSLIPAMAGQAESAARAEAIAFANAMNAAKVVYRTTVDDAEAKWTGSNENRYSLLVNAGLMEGWPTTCNGYPDARFTYVLSQLSGSYTMAIPRFNGAEITQAYKR